MTRSPGRAARAHRVGLAVGLAAALLAGACTSATSSDPSGSTGSTGATGSVPGAGARYTGRPCPFPAPAMQPGRTVTIDCGTLTVPETRSGDGSRGSGATLDLAVARLHLPGGPGAGDPIVYLEGGPGGSALAGIDLWTNPVSPLLTDHDVVLLDQRGTGYSTPRLTCDPEFDAATDDQSDDDLLDRCHTRLVQQGVDLDAYATAAAADDVDDLRAALGVATWPVFGVSYGTRLALELMRRHPAGVRAAVLDSTYPATVPGLEDQPRNFWTALQALLADCRADAACDRAFPDLEARFLRAVDDLDRAPATIPDTDPAASPGDTIEVDGTDLVHLVFDALYVSELIPDVPRALDAAARGRTADAWRLLDAGSAPAAGSGPGGSDAPVPSDEPPSDSDGLFLTVSCAEDAPRASATGTEQAAADVPEPVRHILVDDVRDQLDQCRHWPVRPQPLDLVRSDIPTLVLGGEYDPITPVRWGRVAADTLGRARVIEFPGAGHGIIDAGPCAERVIVAFLAAPATTVDAPPPACAPVAGFTTR